MSLQATINNLIVRVDTKYIGNMTDLMRLSAIQDNASVDGSDLVNIYGEVISVPKAISKTKEYEGFSKDNIQVGDIAIFNYLVISEIVAIPDKDDVEFKNIIRYKGKEYFMVDIRNLFGVIRNGEIIMLNGNVMTTQYEESKIIVPTHLRRIKQAAKCEVLYSGYPKSNEKQIELSPGDTIYYNPFLAQKYQIKGKKFCIITQNKILGKKVS
jgi:co-chaperonin GroES (HSP10)